MNETVYTALLSAISFLTTETCETKQLIQKLLSETRTPQTIEQDQWFDLKGLVKYDPEGRSEPTFYGYAQRKEIPYHKKGRKLLFLKSEIDAWLKEGRRKTNREIEAEASKYLQKKGRD